MASRRRSIVGFLVVVVIGAALLWYGGFINRISELFVQRHTSSAVSLPEQAVETPAAPEVVEVPLIVSPYADYKKIIDDLYQNVSGYRISEEEKHAVRNEGGDPTYGEILYESAQKLLDDVALTREDVFYDLGSGAGKFVMQVYLTTQAKKAVGIELCKTRCEMAQERAEKIRTIAELSSRCAYEIGDVLANVETKNIIKISDSKTIEFNNENILKADLSDATIVFMCSTCFSDELMQKIVDKLAGLQEGLRVLTLKDLPPHDHFKLVRQYQLPMSWSKSSPGSPVYLYKLEKSQPVAVEMEK